MAPPVVGPDEMLACAWFGKVALRLIELFMASKAQQNGFLDYLWASAGEGGGHQGQEAPPH